MQHTLATQYELAWAVADMVATHGTHDFRSGDGGVHRVIWLCGVKIYVEDHLPVRFVGADLDLTLIRDTKAVPYAAALAGPGLRTIHEIAGAAYTLRFDRGDINALRAAHDELVAFIAATAVPHAA